MSATAAAIVADEHVHEWKCLALIYIHDIYGEGQGEWLVEKQVCRCGEKRDNGIRLDVRKDGKA